MGRPPLGTRWGDLSPEQRAALPVGTVLSGLGDGTLFHPVVKVAPRRWLDLHDQQGVTQWVLHFNRTILSYPNVPEPDPRDSDGLDSNEGGGEMRGGDNDTDGDVPEVAREVARLVLDYGGYAYMHAEETQTGRGISTRYSGLVRFYWPADCEGAEDAPRDCLEGA